MGRHRLATTRRRRWSVPAAAVVVETMVALVLARAALEKFGGDNVAETKRNLEAYVDALAVR